MQKKEVANGCGYADIEDWSREYLIERYKDLVEIEKEHKKENGELRERVEELETAYLLQKDRSIELATTIDALTTDYKEEKEKNNNLIHELRIYQNETISKNKIREIFDNYSQSSLMENNTFLEFKKELLEERN